MHIKLIIRENVKANKNTLPVILLITVRKLTILVKNKTKDIKLKTFYKCAAETGVRLNELLGICYESVDFDNGGVWIDHSIDDKNRFRPYEVKTSRRFIELSNELLDLFSIWMKTQIHPVTHKQIVSGPNGAAGEWGHNQLPYRAAKKVKQSAKKLGIDWKSGLSPFRKWSISRMEILRIKKVIKFLLKNN